MALNIDFSQRSYGGKKFRPMPHVIDDSSRGLLLCITPWGRADIVETVSDTIQNFLNTANEDTDLTIAFAKKQTLEKRGNNLRTAIIMASEKIFKDFNKEEYSAGFEIFAAIQEGPQWSYVSCGQPYAVLHRQGMGIMPLCQSLDLNILTPIRTIHDPLPNQILGLGQNPPIQFGNLRLCPSDQLAFVSRTYLPHEFYKLSPKEFSQDTIAETLARENQEAPFWLGFAEVA